MEYSGIFATFQKVEQELITPKRILMTSQDYTGNSNGKTSGKQSEIKTSAVSLF